MERVRGDLLVHVHDTSCSSSWQKTEVQSENVSTYNENSSNYILTMPRYPCVFWRRFGGGCPEASPESMASMSASLDCCNHSLSRGDQLGRGSWWYSVSDMPGLVASLGYTNWAITEVLGERCSPGISPQFIPGVSALGPRQLVESQMSSWVERWHF